MVSTGYPWLLAMHYAGESWKIEPRWESTNEVTIRAVGKELTAWSLLQSNWSQSASVPCLSLSPYPLRLLAVLAHPWRHGDITFSGSSRLRALTPTMAFQLCWQVSKSNLEMKNEISVNVAADTEADKECCVRVDFEQIAWFETPANSLFDGNPGERRGRGTETLIMQPFSGPRNTNVAPYFFRLLPTIYGGLRLSGTYYDHPYHNSYRGLWYLLQTKQARHTFCTSWHSQSLCYGIWSVSIYAW